jgi:hypothetical protein
MIISNIATWKCMPIFVLVIVPIIIVLFRRNVFVEKSKAGNIRSAIKSCLTPS